MQPLYLRVDTIGRTVLKSSRTAVVLPRHDWSLGRDSNPYLDGLCVTLIRLRAGNLSL